MTDAGYILGSDEYVPFELDIETPGTPFVIGEWTAQVAICPETQPFKAASADWKAASLVADGKRVLALARTTTLAPTAGTFKGFVKLTRTGGGAETPVIPAVGRLIFGTG